MKPIGRVTEWETGSRDNANYLVLMAEAQYARGSRPRDAEIAVLEQRVKARFPTAEFCRMTRSFVPSCSKEYPVRVWWHLEWIVFED